MSYLISRAKAYNDVCQSLSRLLFTLVDGFPQLILSLSIGVIWLMVSKLWGYIYSYFNINFSIRIYRIIEACSGILFFILVDGHNNISLIHAYNVLQTFETTILVSQNKKITKMHYLIKLLHLSMAQLLEKYDNSVVQLYFVNFILINMIYSILKLFGYKFNKALTFKLMQFLLICIQLIKIFYLNFNLLDIVSTIYFLIIIL
jgi:hypothetical protein